MERKMNPYLALKAAMAEGSVQSSMAVAAIAKPIWTRWELIALAASGIPLWILIAQAAPLLLLHAGVLEASSSGFMLLTLLVGIKGGLVTFAVMELHRWGAQRVPANRVLTQLGRVESGNGRARAAARLAQVLAAGQETHLWMWQWSILLRLAEGRGGSIQQKLDSLILPIDRSAPPPPSGGEKGALDS